MLTFCHDLTPPLVPLSLVLGCLFISHPHCYPCLWLWEKVLDLGAETCWASVKWDDYSKSWHYCNHYPTNLKEVGGADTPLQNLCWSFFFLSFSSLRFLSRASLLSLPFPPSLSLSLSLSRKLHISLCLYARKMQIAARLRLSVFGSYKSVFAYALLSYLLACS